MCEHGSNFYLCINGVVDVLGMTVCEKGGRDSKKKKMGVILDIYSHPGVTVRLTPHAPLIFAKTRASGIILDLYGV